MMINKRLYIISKRFLPVIDRHSLAPKQTGNNTAFTLSNLWHRGKQDIKKIGYKIIQVLTGKKTNLKDMCAV